MKCIKHSLPFRVWYLVQHLSGWCLSGPFGQSLLWFSSVFAPCSSFSLPPGCESCSVFPFPLLSCLPESLFSVTCWAALNVGVTFPERANLIPCAVVRTKSPKALASAVHLQPFNSKYCKEAMLLSLFCPPSWSHSNCLHADCSSAQSQWFSWPIDEEIAVWLFRCC